MKATLSHRQTRNLLARGLEGVRLIVAKPFPGSDVTLAVGQDVTEEAKGWPEEALRVHVKRRYIKVEPRAGLMKKKREAVA